MLTSFAAEPDETIHDPSERQSSASDTPMVDRPPIERETDPVRLALRQKQIDYGRNTRGYDQYSLLKPRYYCYINVIYSLGGPCGQRMIHGHLIRAASTADVPGMD